MTLVYGPTSHPLRISERILIYTLNLLRQSFIVCIIIIKKIFDYLPNLFFTVILYFSLVK